MRTYNYPQKNVAQQQSHSQPPQTYIPQSVAQQPHHMLQAQPGHPPHILPSHTLHPYQQSQQQIRPPSTILTPPVSQIIGPTFMEPQQQYLAAIPVQPVTAFADPSVIQSISPNSSAYSVHNVPTGGVVLTPSQNQIQDQLQRKHEELQHLIVQQQEELRRVQEQLLMARYGIIPSIVNVTIPFSTAPPATATSSNDNGIGGVNGSPYNPYLHHDHHPSLPLQPQICVQSSSNQGNLGQIDQHSHPPQQSNRGRGGGGGSNMSVASRDTDEMISYMQLTPVPLTHLQQRQQQAVRPCFGLLL